MSALPQGWGICKLGDLTEYVTSGSRDWSKYYSSEGALFVRTQDINTNKLAPVKSIARVSLPERVEGKRTLIKKGDLLITITGANVGKCAFVDRAIPEAYVSQSVALVRMKDQSVTPFVHKQLLSPASNDGRTLLQQSAYGLGRPVLNLDNVRDISLKIAPAAEQKRIADKLDAVLARVDACRERLDRIPAILKRFRQSVLAAATSGKLTEEWRLENVIESQWTPAQVGDVYDLIDGDRGPNYPKQSDYQSAGHCLFLSTKNVRPFGFVFDDLVYISKAKHQQLRNGTLQIDDVVITTRGTLGNVAHFDSAVAVAHKVVRINSGMLILRAKEKSRVLPAYLKLFIASPNFYQQLAQKQSGSAQPQIPAGVLKQFGFELPTTTEQVEIVRRVEEIFEYADRIEARYATARAQVEHLTPALLAKAFRGELVPQDPSDEPASVLLERIRATQETGAAGKKRTARN